MAEPVLGQVGTKKLFENERVIVWEMRLPPGAKEPLHRHERDYVMVQIDGDRIAADIDPRSTGSYAAWGGQRIEGDVANGTVLFAAKGGVESAVNIGAKEFYEIIVELKD
jgi:hypothetical protein